MTLSFYAWWRTGVPGYVNSGLCHDRSRHLQTPGAAVRAGHRLPVCQPAEETVIVTAQPIDSAISPTQGYSAKTSAGATKTDQPLITTAQSVSVITRQQMDDQGANTISRALEYTPGFTPASAAAQPALIRYRYAATTAVMLITCFSTACA